MEILWANQNSSLISKFKENCRNVLLLTCFSVLRNTTFGFRALHSTIVQYIRMHVHSEKQHNQQAGNYTATLQRFK